MMALASFSDAIIGVFSAMSLEFVMFGIATLVYAFFTGLVPVFAPGARKLSESCSLSEEERVTCDLRYRSAFKARCSLPSCYDELADSWGSTFVAKAAGRHCADVFTDAAHMLHVLKSGNMQDSVETEAFTACLSSLLTTCDTSCPKSLMRAQEMVACAAECAECLPKGADLEMKGALEVSLKREKAEHAKSMLRLVHEDEKIRDEGDRVSESVRLIPERRKSTAPMAMGALAVLGKRHRGLNIAAAQRSLGAAATISA